MWIKVYQSIYFLTARFTLNTMVIFIFMYNSFFYESKRDFYNSTCPFLFSPYPVLSQYIPFYEVRRNIKMRCCNSGFISNMCKRQPLLEQRKDSMKTLYNSRHTILDETIRRIKHHLCRNFLFSVQFCPDTVDRYYNHHYESEVGPYRVAYRETVRPINSRM